MPDLDWLKGLRERATEGTFHVHGAGSYKISADDSRLIAAAVNLLGPLVEVLEEVQTERHDLSCVAVSKIAAALAAIKAERQRQEFPK